MAKIIKIPAATKVLPSTPILQEQKVIKMEKAAANEELEAATTQAAKITAMQKQMDAMQKQIDTQQQLIMLILPHVRLNVTPMVLPGRVQPTAPAVTPIVEVPKVA